MELTNLLNKIKVNIFDRNLQPIDKNIKPLILALWNKNYKTDVCCEGHLDFRRRSKSYPYVALSVKENDLKELAKKISAYNYSEPTIKWSLAKSYFPMRPEKGFFYELAPRRDKRLPTKLLQFRMYQADIKNLANFLTNN